MAFAGSYDPVLPGEVKTFSIDFVKEIVPEDNIQTFTDTLDVFFGSDENAATLISGEPAIIGTKAVRMIGGGGYGFQSGVTYRWTVTAITEGGSIIISYAHLPCRAIV